MIRIDNIEFKKYTSTKIKESLYEIVKWQTNYYFGREEEYKNDGYVESFGGNYLQKNGHSIDKSFFNNKETCFVLAFIEKGSESWKLRSVGETLLDLTPEEWNNIIGD